LDKGCAAIENNGKMLSEQEVNAVLEDVYVPRFRLNNQALRNWFGETDAWWFDNVHNNIECLASPVSRAIAATIALGVGDYALSFTDDTLELRAAVIERFSAVCGRSRPRRSITGRTI
jgi:hypothetical protein